MFEFKFKFIILWKILPALVALLWCFPRVCWHVAFKMTFVVKALSHWLQLLQRMYFWISCKFTLYESSPQSVLKCSLSLSFCKKILSPLVAWLWCFPSVCHHVTFYIALCYHKKYITSHRGEYQISTLQNCLSIYWHIVKII